MNNKFWLSIILLLLATFSLAACGTEKEDSVIPENPATEQSEPEKEPIDEITKGAMEPAIEQVDDNTYRYTLVNQTEQPHTFEFTSSQRYDFSLANEKGEQVFLFSSVSTYLQVLGDISVDQGDKLTYDFAIPSLDLEPGTYKLTAWLTPKESGNFEVSMEHLVK
ncbi:BsuPI-related putative proteinase inhibitor [Planococcus versutus]|uniref:Intracellular proteinase inhibitor (BsuPI) n=1 Tax=Planococcus versutus TaxID=1302659 RepID=A0A1B1RYX4_9BACL|nr:BsuPI-related putative proteinase inhibitor [Planococcus versutus]ANU26168.1 intracellular proteinase inhibitor (BsuPI) [Planococcus versutus]